MIRRPPRSPLFPYPPLFRSLEDCVLEPGGRQPRPVERLQAEVRDQRLAPRVERGPRHLIDEEAFLAVKQKRGRDGAARRSEEHTSGLQSQSKIVCPLLLLTQ